MDRTMEGKMLWDSLFGDATETVQGARTMELPYDGRSRFLDPEAADRAFGMTALLQNMAAAASTAGQADAQGPEPENPQETPPEAKPQSPPAQQADRPDGPTGRPDKNGGPWLRYDPALNRMVFFDGENFYDYEARNRVTSDKTPIEPGFKSKDVQPYPFVGPKPRFGPGDCTYIETWHPNGKDIHGGGSGLPDPYAPRQGWIPTQGCIRMQNEDVDDLSTKIRGYKIHHPGTKIPFSVRKR